MCLVPDPRCLHDQEYRDGDVGRGGTTCGWHRTNAPPPWLHIGLLPLRHGVIMSPERPRLDECASHRGIPVCCFVAYNVVYIAIKCIREGIKGGGGGGWAFESMTSYVTRPEVSNTSTLCGVHRCYLLPHPWFD
jgi:hypothetical protein